MKQNINPAKLSEAIGLIQEESRNSKRGFIESVDMILMVSSYHGFKEGSIRGTLSLPHGTGKQAKVAVFVKNEMQKANSLRSGALAAGIEDLISKIESSKIEYDFCLATPDAMSTISKIAKKLGPRGLMPSQKDETISANIEDLVSEFIKNRVKYKCTKSGIIQCAVGTIEQDLNFIRQNIIHAHKSITDNLLLSSKSESIVKAYIKSTMGRSHRVLIA